MRKTYSRLPGKQGDQVMRTENLSLGVGRPMSKIRAGNQNTTVSCVPALDRCCVFAGKDQRVLLEGLGPAHMTLSKSSNLSVD